MITERYCCDTVAYVRVVAIETGKEFQLVMPFIMTTPRCFFHNTLIQYLTSNRPNGTARASLRMESAYFGRYGQGSEHLCSKPRGTAILSPNRSIHVAMKISEKGSTNFLHKLL